MESLGQNSVLKEAENKETRQKTKTEKEQDKALKVEAKSAKKEALDSESPLKRLISYIELGGILLLVGYFRKPLIKLGEKIFSDIEDETQKITSKIKASIESEETQVRNLIIESYFMDPIQAYRIGGTVYEELIINADWANTIYGHLDPIPAEVDPKFIIGTGGGSLTVRNTLSRALSLQIIGLSEYMIANGQDLSK